VLGGGFEGAVTRGGGRRIVGGVRVVIIGNGVAGMEAALAVRARQPDWQITIVSEESDHFFSRTALMWVFSGQMSHRDIEPLERDAYARLGFRRVRARVIAIDVDRHELTLAGDIPPLSYDRLLLACGSRPRPGPWPGSDALGVGHFVTLQDLYWYERELLGEEAATEPPHADAHLQATTEDSPYRFREVASERRGVLAKKPAIIGGGLIGIEAVEVAVAAGLRPSFFIREEWFWPIALDQRESTWISDRMREHGVDVHLQHDVEALETDGDGSLTAVRTNQGRFESDCAVIAIGVIPNTEWLQGSGVEIDERGGIVVDAGLCASAPDVFAAGDCTSVRWFDGSQRPEQLWYTARDQGRVAARSMLGDDVRYARGTWYNSAKLMDIEYTTAGLVNFGLEGEQNWFFEETGKVRSTNRIVTQGDRVIGFNMLGRRWDHSVFIGWIEERRTLSWVLHHLNEAAFDTEFVPPLRVARS
jgi:NADPH-dependent 2,4-dienoyl-CoA reductase/sulfur reductase-like enzyme